MPDRSGRRAALIALLGVTYVLATHGLMTAEQPTAWHAVGVIGPMLCAVALGAWRGGQRLLGGIAGTALGALLLQALRGAPVSMQALSLAQHVGIHLFLAYGFGSTLLDGRTALITTLASRLHRTLTPAMARYTRQVTLAWTFYFLAMAGLSVAIHASMRFEHWAFFANFVTPLAVVAMFGSEYLLRYRLHPDFERSSVADAIRSYRQGPAAAVGAAPRETVR